MYKKSGSPFLYDEITNDIVGIMDPDGSEKVFNFSDGGSVVTITGVPNVGETLTATLSAGWTATGYQWTRDGTNISGQTGSTYVLETGDQGKNITCRVSGLSYVGGAVPIAAAVTTLGNLTLATPTFSTSAVAGAVISAINGKTAGSTITTTDDRFTVSGSNLLRGLGAVTAGVSSVQLVETLAGATNTPKTSTPAITVTASSGFDIVLVAGQSNMHGRTTYNASLDTLDGNVYQYSNFPTDPNYQTIQAAEYPLSLPDQINTGRVGPAMQFAKRYFQLTGRKVLLVPVAVGGTSIFGGTPRWKPTSPFGDLYTDAINKTNAAITAANAIESGSNFVGTIWFQGETDGDNGVSSTNYQNTMAVLIAGLRAGITGGSNSWFVMSQMVPEAISTRAGYPAIDTAHQYLATVIKKSALVNTSDLTGFSSDNLHFNLGSSVTEGIREVGTRMANAVATASAFSGLAPVATSAPVISGGSFTGDTLTSTTGTWNNIPLSYTYQWKRDGVNISGATSSTYTLVTADETKNILCTVTAVNETGSTSANSNVIVASAPVSSTDIPIRFTGLNGMTETVNGSGGYNYANASAAATDYANTSNYKLLANATGYFRVGLVSTGTTLPVAILTFTNTQTKYYGFGIYLEGSIYKFIQLGTGGISGNVVAARTYAANDILQIRRGAGGAFFAEVSSDGGVTFDLLHNFVTTNTAECFPFLDLAAGSTGSYTFTKPRMSSTATAV